MAESSKILRRNLRRATISRGNSRISRGKFPAGNGYRGKYFPRKVFPAGSICCISPLFVFLLHAQRAFCKFFSALSAKGLSPGRPAGHPEVMPIQKGRFGAVRFFVKNRFFAFFYAFRSRNSYFRSELLIDHRPKLHAKNERRKWSYVKIYRKP